MTNGKKHNQAVLAAFNATTHQCQHEGCTRLTARGLCDRHRVPAPTGEWAIAEQVRAELDRQHNER